MSARSFIILAVIVTLTACARDKPTVVVYTSVDQVFSQAVFDEFERRSGIDVRAVYDTEETKSTGVLNRLIAEGDHPQADVFWSGDPVRPYLLIKRGLVDTYISPQAHDIPSPFKAADGTWTGAAARARVLLVNRQKNGARPLPSSILDLADPRWKGEAAIANPLYGTTTMHAGALFAQWGEEKTRAYFDALRSNQVVVASSNGEVKRLVAAGEVAFGLLDTDDANDAVSSDAAVEIVYPDQDGVGTMFMPTSVVLIKNGPNRASATQLIDYLLSEATDEKMAANGAHIPLRGKAQSGASLPHGLRTMVVNYARVADEIERNTPWLRTWVGL